ncbi:MAG TPA: GTPase domain-containing protein [Acidobacteriota bacterium]|nr:GTPase domain-containing protein [Acidobacteriota bacterium]HNH83865.1 GTPase domain-containing protein [Acidobacteriota bacterium]
MKGHSMLVVDHQKKELHCKIVYYGPGLAGKTTNMRYLYDTLNSGIRSEFVTHETDESRELTFSFPAGKFKALNDYVLYFHLYTVPGSFYVRQFRKQILENVDGVIFVVDSHPRRLEAGVEFLNDLKENLQALEIDFQSLPFVLQLNKRDTPEAVSIEELTTKLRCKNEPVIEAVADQGIGVVEAFRAIAQQFLQKHHTTH